MSENRDRWRERLEELVGKVREWVDPDEWVTRVYPKKMRDVDGEVFEVPALFLQKGPTRLLLDPIAYDAPGSEGVVDLYLMPSYDDEASLSFVQGRWQVHYTFRDEAAPSGIKPDEALEFTQQTLSRVLDEIAAHAVHPV